VTLGIEVHNMFANDDVVWISWQFSSEERVPSPRHTNEVIGAYVTAGARLYLYSYLDRLKGKPICTDTDCYIHTTEKRILAKRNGGQFRANDFGTET
jgi:hypothetical protein